MPLSAITWDCCLWDTSVDDSWRRFKDVLFTAADECIPKVTLQEREKEDVAIR